MSLTGVVFNIQRFTVHDGPGIRTELFLKGCTLRCKWCSNPESFLVKKQVGVYGVKCIGLDQCGACIRECDKDPVPFLIDNDKIVGINRDICDECMKCVGACPSDALKAWGEEMTVDQVMEIILADRTFYEKSGGGVTISGGEALVQWEFTSEILKRCKEEGVHTCVETALGISKEVLDRVLPFCDMLITDIKLMDNDLHCHYTGIGNEEILNNIKYVDSKGIPLIIRLPIIPNVNDNMDHIEKVGEFIKQQLTNKLVQVQFLRFRRLGEEKYKSLGLPYLMNDVNPERTQFENEIKAMVDQLQGYGIPAYAGTTHKIEL